MFEHIDFPEPAIQPIQTILITVRIDGEFIVKGVATMEKEEIEG